MQYADYDEDGYSASEANDKWKANEDQKQWEKEIIAEVKKLTIDLEAARTDWMTAFMNGFYKGLESAQREK